MAEYTISAIETKIIKTITDVSGIDADTLSSETSLTNDLNLDSLSLFEIVIELETFYDLRISDEENRISENDRRGCSVHFRPVKTKEMTIFAK
jgi:acyl carrier protein